MKTQKFIYFILLAGFLVRLLFILKGADYYYSHGSKFINNDSGSFSNSFINLFTNGQYTFNFQHPDAAYYRLPGYPFFWGLHYLIFGKWVYMAVAVTQILLDTLAIWLVYKILLKIGTLIMARTGAFIYAFYPFIIIWTTITGSELLGTFLCILYIFLFTYYSSSRYFPVLAGLLCTYMFFTREYLGIFFPFSLIYFLWFRDSPSMKIKIKSTLYFSLVFISIYSLWPLRNYIRSGKVILLHGKYPGYTRLQNQYLDDDFTAFRDWMYSWNEGLDPYFGKIIKTNEEVTFPENAFCSAEEKITVDSLISECRRCGSSFYAWRHKTFTGVNCNEEIANGFNLLRANYIKCKPSNYYFLTPVKNLKKSIFKSDFQNADSKSYAVQFIQTILFGYRSFLIIVGFIGLLALARIKPILLIAAFCVFMYFFIVFYIRQIEMRYFLQADTLLLIPASMLIGRLIEKLLGRYMKKN